MLFPQLSNFPPELKKLILERAGNNRLVSGYIPWVRLSASTGLVLESFPEGDSFTARYNSEGQSGRVGTDFAGKSVYVDGQSDRIFRPSPIVEGLGVSFSAGGLSRKCSFAIKCFTLKQAEKVMEYFLEPGYTVLVEYGWNTPESLSQKVDLDACEIAKFNSYDHVKKKQEKSKYQYDGFMGYITNGGMKSGEAETYIIEVELTSLGDTAMYLQQHRGGTTKGDSSSGSGIVYDTGLIDQMTGVDLGYALFMQMVNRLPMQKQTHAVRNLAGKLDDRGNAWKNEANFINMDEEIRETLIESLQNTAVASGTGGDAKIPDSVPLVSNFSYIRLALAFEILNTYSAKLESTPTKCGLGTYSYIIDYKNTICRAHKYMFSHDGSKLYIPNPTAPDFKLTEALTATSKLDLTSILTGGVPTKTVDLTQWKWMKDKYAFPQQVSLSQSGHKWPSDAIPFDAGPGQWGYLKDLYINFEFFCEILERSNYVSRDVYYEILNGISSAANSIWQFDIKQIPSVHATNKDQYHMEVVDMNFCGSVSKDIINAKFRASGTDTPFIESSFSMDMPGAMKNMIVAERQAGGPAGAGGNAVDSSPEGNLPAFTNNFLFSKRQDPVIEILSSFKPLNDTGTASQAAQNAATVPTDEEIRKQNYELFMSKAVVLPMIKDRNANLDAVKNKFVEFFLGAGSSTDTTIEALVTVGAWSDTALFRKLDLNTKDSKSANNILLNFYFDFKIHGVSGIKTGDLFEIQDLPEKYSGTVFQVTEVSHSLNGTMWTTDVKGQMRRYDEE